MSRDKESDLDLYLGDPYPDLRREEAWLEAADSPIKVCPFCGVIFNEDENGVKDGHCRQCTMFLTEQEDIEKRRRIEARVTKAMADQDKKPMPEPASGYVFQCVDCAEPCELIWANVGHGGGGPGSDEWHWVSNCCFARFYLVKEEGSQDVTL